MEVGHFCIRLCIDHRKADTKKSYLHYKIDPRRADGGRAGSIDAGDGIDEDALLDGLVKFVEKCITVDGFG